MIVPILYPETNIIYGCQGSFSLHARYHKVTRSSIYCDLSVLISICLTCIPLFFYARLKSRSSLGLCFGVSSQLSGYFSDSKQLGCMNNLTLFPNAKVPIYIMNGICGCFRFLTNWKLIQLIPCIDFISACITASTRKYNFELIGIFKTGLDILFKGKEYTRSKYLRN